MSKDKEREVHVIRTPSGTIEIRQHPQEIIDVEPEILARMEAKLTGQSFADVYGDEDRVSSDFVIHNELKKLRRVFSGSKVVSGRFTSIQALKELRHDLRFEDVDRDLLGHYALRKCDGLFVDECDLYSAMISGAEIVTKQSRYTAALNSLHDSPELRSLLVALGGGYLGSNLQTLQITKEVMQLEVYVRELVATDRAVILMDRLLARFYGAANE